nr:AbrB/MazE/SpoVT family DNA-binding domain-containing protein [Anoxybacillus sp.]
MLHADRKVLKIGNSLGVTFPIEFLQKLDIHQGDEIQMELENNQIARVLIIHYFTKKHRII